MALTLALRFAYFWRMASQTAALRWEDGSKSTRSSWVKTSRWRAFAWRAAFAQVAVCHVVSSEAWKRAGTCSAVKWERLWNRLLKVSTVWHEASQQIGLSLFISNNARFGISFDRNTR